MPLSLPPLRPKLPWSLAWIFAVVSSLVSHHLLLALTCCSHHNAQSDTFKTKIRSSNSYLKPSSVFPLTQNKRENSIWWPREHFVTKAPSSLPPITFLTSPSHHSLLYTSLQLTASVSQRHLTNPMLSRIDMHSTFAAVAITLSKRKEGGFEVVFYTVSLQNLTES